jgi:hypothetical protein
LTPEHHALSDRSGALSDDGILTLRVVKVQIRVGADGFIASIGSPTESSQLRLTSAVMSQLVLRVGREVGLVHVVENMPNPLTSGLCELAIDADPSLPCIICTMRLDNEHGIGCVRACSNEVVVEDAEHVRRDGSRARLRRICRQGRADRISALGNKLARVIADARKQIGQLISSTRSDVTARRIGLYDRLIFEVLHLPYDMLDVPDELRPPSREVGFVELRNRRMAFEERHRQVSSRIDRNRIGLKLRVLCVLNGSRIRDQIMNRPSGETALRRFDW